ncbi:MAG: amino acid kinase, partial [Candidatus Hydrothermarchaeales archaeon]
QEAAHTTAILATHQYGHLLSGLSGIPTITSLEEFKGQAILLPLNIVVNSDLEASWDVTSDTIACYVARLAGEKEFIKFTDVDGILIGGRLVETISAGKLLNTTTCLDKSLPTYLQTWNMNCRVTNGKTESNIRRALEGEPLGTLITGGK